jgi:tRNA pseudouridine55 synthase
VRIDRIDVLDFDPPHLRIEVRCGKGTYIRSLARDLGERLGCGAYLAGLRRTRVGPFIPELAVPLDSSPEFARERLLPMTAAVADLPQVMLAHDAVSRLRDGQAVKTAVAVADHSEVAILDPAGRLVAIATADQTGQAIRPAKVFPA